MKTKQLKKYIGKIVTYRTVWDTFETARLIEMQGYSATFEKEGNKIYIKIYNIAQILLKHNLEFTYGGIGEGFTDKICGIQFDVESKG